jgi:hypothetical protein
MTAPDPKAPDSGLPLPRWVLWLALPGAIAPIAIFGFILLTESAHDEASCPFRELTRRTASEDAVVIEESRHCIGDVEERRFVVVRNGQRQVLGERRFAPALFAPEVYSWELKVSEQGETHVRVAQKGHGAVVFREGTADERAKEREKQQARESAGER